MWRLIWRGKCYFSHFSANSAGVAILFHPKSYFRFIGQVCIIKGRAVLITFEMYDITYNVLNVYAPNEGNERTLFYNELYTYVMTMDNRDYLFIVGDYNCTLNANLDRGSKHESHIPSSAKLAKIIKDYHMIDCYRHLYPGHHDYTWSNIRSQARIDRIYIPSYCCGK